MRIPVRLPHAHRLLNHGPTTLVTTAHGGRRNVMAAAWVMPLDFEPCRLAAVVAADTFTRELLAASGECVVQAPTTLMVDLTVAVGTSSGRDGDKFARLGMDTAPASLVGAPLVEGCAAWLECRVVPEPAIAERYDLFVLESLPVPRLRQQHRREPFRQTVAAAVVPSAGTGDAQRSRVGGGRGHPGPGS